MTINDFCFYDSTEEHLQKNIQGSQNFINEEKSASNKVSGK